MNESHSPESVPVGAPSQNVPSGEACTESPSPAGAFARAPGSASSSPADQYDEDDFDNGENRCHVCLGEGFVFGDELDDPDWYEPGETYRCPCCGGSGDAKDCTYW